jgi:hypothetical protein
VAAGRCARIHVSMSSLSVAVSDPGYTDNMQTAPWVGCS